MDEGAREAKSWVKYVAIGCGVVLLLGACAFGLMFYSCNAAYQAATAPGDAVHALLRDLRGGELEAAYGRMSEGFRAAHDRDAFRALVEANPALAEQTDFTVTGVFLDPEGGSVRGLLRTPSGTVSLEARLVEDAEGGYAIDALTVAGSLDAPTALPPAPADAAPADVAPPSE